MIHNKKGFSLIELMAVITIIGIVAVIGVVVMIRINDKAKKEYYKSQQELIIASGKAYFNSNVELLPKNIGYVSNVTLKVLIDTDYLKPVNDDKNKACSNKDLEKSKVYVTKINYENYHYSLDFYCNNYEEKVDKTKPSVVFNPKKDTKAKSFNVQVTVSDNSDLSYISYLVKGEEPPREMVINNNNRTFTVVLNQEGIYQVNVVVIDIYGNKTEVLSPQYEIDETAPVKPILTNKVIGFTNKDNNIVVTSAIDVVKTECKTDTSNYVSCNKIYPVSSNTTVYARSYDAAGNVSEVATLVVGNIDKTLPTGNLTLVENTSEKKTLKIDTADNLSGVKQIRYRISTNDGGVYGGWSGYVATGSNVVLDVPGQNRVQVEITDNALNVAILTSNSYLIEEIIPPIPPIINVSDTNWTNDKVIVTIAYDPTAESNLWSMDGYSWVRYTKELTLYKNETVYAKSIRRKLSNESNRPITNIDKIRPNISGYFFEVSGDDDDEVLYGAVGVYDTESGLGAWEIKGQQCTDSKCNGSINDVLANSYGPSPVTGPENDPRAPSWAKTCNDAKYPGTCTIFRATVDINHKTWWDGKFCDNAGNCVREGANSGNTSGGGGTGEPGKPTPTCQWVKKWPESTTICWTSSSCGNGPTPPSASSCTVTGKEYWQKLGTPQYTFVGPNGCNIDGWRGSYRCSGTTFDGYQCQCS